MITFEQHFIDHAHGHNRLTEGHTVPKPRCTANRTRRYVDQIVCGAILVDGWKCPFSEDHDQ